jgi:hypothetical protein
VGGEAVLVTNEHATHGSLWVAGHLLWRPNHRFRTLPFCLIDEEGEGGKRVTWHGIRLDWAVAGWRTGANPVRIRLTDHDTLLAPIPLRRLRRRDPVYLPLCSQ